MIGTNGTRSLEHLVAVPGVTKVELAVEASGVCLRRGPHRPAHLGRPVCHAVVFA